MNFKCPGQDDRKISTEEIKCPGCGKSLEIFSDEVKVRCPSCKELACRERLPTCVDWCNFAQDCVGHERFQEYQEARAKELKAKLIKELEDYFGSDSRRINHAKKVLQFSEELIQAEGADWRVVVPVSILHDVGIKVAEEKYGSSAGNLQEIEGPEVARKIMLKLGLKKAYIDEVCLIIGAHHSPGKIETQNFRVLYDADLLVNLKEEKIIFDKEKLEGVIKKSFLTKTGKQIAEKLYL